MKILFLMLFLHIIDDFVLQPQCLSNLKQRMWWISECNKQNLNIKNYDNDYITAMFIHALSWSIIIHIPLFFIVESDMCLVFSVGLNMLIHAFVDDMKANANILNLTQDQIVHFLQIIITFICFTMI